MPSPSLSSGQQLARFSNAVRESTLTRLAQVQPEDRQWRARPGLLSFADLLKHLVDADQWILDVLCGNPQPRRAVIAPEDGRNSDWAKLLQELTAHGRSKFDRLVRLSDTELSQSVDDSVFGRTTWWWLIVRGNLDHEIHHRGALQLALRLRYG